MFLIVEGANGTGKSTLVRHFTSGLGFIEFRPFARFREDGHWKNTTPLARGGICVPVNSPVEDLFIADAVATVHNHQPKSRFISDRSLPSAFAYEGTGAEQCLAYMDVWYRSLITVPKAILFVASAYETARSRLAPERDPGPERYAHLQSEIYRHCVTTGFPMRAIDTTDTSKSGAFAIALEYYLEMEKIYGT